MFIICLPIVHFALALQVRAEEVSLSTTGNGEGSVNSTQVQNNNTTSVNQSNNLNVTNNVSTTTNTGNNTASDNSGNSTIQTGDTTSTTTINNENINTNTSNINPCCSGSTTNIEISGNGEGSDNSVNSQNNVVNNVRQTNNANIYNNATTNSNTGYNSADNNGGDVLIKTGNIHATTKITNKNINNSYATGGSVEYSLHAVILNNGEDSENRITVENSHINNLFVLNTANIENNASHNLNTGYNSANGNLGDVAILTGDITSEIEIVNENINSSTAILPCLTCNETEDPVIPPSNPPSINSGGGESKTQGSSGSAGGSVLGAMLPATGLPFMFYATLLLVFLFLSGLYLRYHSGVSPPVVAK